MIVKTLQILWHDKLPVLSAAFHSSGALVTAGADHEVKVSARRCLQSQEQRRVFVAQGQSHQIKCRSGQSNIKGMQTCKWRFKAPSRTTVKLSTVSASKVWHDALALHCQ